DYYCDSWDSRGTQF
nr:immunoglobulin light chain junction region [Macaca mulatta]MOV66082.1 immunoglobulin light chain junction region [Macaca mulatta]MOV66309.1 immunoglobulin light chain junction region [Macaca mulatta]MOV66366.1 immunoglobulin light chain junction region [Macaca mulatta]MOV66475.1 immunoglobulin light chain junction region [Macaca mulatta]